MNDFTLAPCEKCGGEGCETKGYGYPFYIGGIEVGRPFGNVVVCTKCGYHTNAYYEPWEAIRAWNHQPMKYFIESAKEEV